MESAIDTLRPLLPLGCLAAALLLLVRGLRLTLGALPPHEADAGERPNWRLGIVLLAVALGLIALAAWAVAVETIP